MVVDCEASGTSSHVVLMMITPFYNAIKDIEWIKIISFPKSDALGDVKWR